MTNIELNKTDEGWNLSWEQEVNGISYGDFIRLIGEPTVQDVAEALIVLRDQIRETLLGVQK